jgi:hypothetical protein
MNIDIDGTIVELPDGLSEDEMTKQANTAKEQLSKLNDTQTSSPAPEKPSFFQRIADAGKSLGGKLFGRSTPGTELGQTVGENVLGPVGGVIGRAIANNPQPVVNQAPVAGMTAGDIAGNIIAPGSNIVAPALSGLGGAAGEAVKQIDTAALGNGTQPTSTAAFDEIAKQGAIGLGTGLAGVGIGKAGKFMKDIGAIDSINPISGETPWAAKALGATKRFLNSPDKLERAKEVGQTMVDQGIIKPFSNAEEMASEVAKLKDTSGKAVGDFLESNGVKFNPQSIVDNLNAIRPKDAAGNLLKGGNWDIINNRIDNAVETVMAHAKDTTKIKVGKGGLVGLEKAKELMPINFQDANKIKGVLQDTTNWDGREIKDVADKMIAGTVKNSVDSALNDAAVSSGNQEEMAQFLKNKKLYSHAQTAEDYIHNRLSSEYGNKTIGLTDWIAAISSLSHGNPLGAGALIGAKRAAERYGSQIMATSPVPLAGPLQMGLRGILSRYASKQK